MKKIYSLATIALAGAALTGCNDFLDDNRYPLDRETNNAAFWSMPDNCQAEVDWFYNQINAYGNGGGGGAFFFSQLTDDQCAYSFRDWNYINVPSSSSNWSTPYEIIRHAEYIIQGVRNSSLSAEDKYKFEGIAKLNRADQYFDLVRKYGNVVWVGKVVETNDNDILYGPRTSRDVVMDSVLRDLDYAIATIPAATDKMTWSHDLALAMKSYICLWEGTFCKYCTKADNDTEPNPERAKKYLEESVKASAELLPRYTVDASYSAKYHSLAEELAANPEVIFMRAYKNNVKMHSTISYTASSTETAGISKDLFDSYLFIDGKPLASTGENKSDAGEVTPDGKSVSIAKLLAVRDGRLAETIDPYLMYANMTYDRAGCTGIWSTTGYGVLKFDNITLPVSARQNSAKNYTSCPLYWISAVMCEYAEAKAELGTLSNDDLNKSINQLFTRSGLPARTVAELSAINDPKAAADGVSSLLYEIRRCRRCELAMDKDFRYWDLVRWHQLDKLDSQKNPDIFLGANISMSPIAVTEKSGSYMDGSQGKTRTYMPRYYLYPIPSGQLTLNPNLEQNHLWK